MTEEALQKHYFMAKLAGKTTYPTLKKEPSPQKHIIRAMEESDDEYQQVFLSKREQQNADFAVSSQRIQTIE